MRVLAVTAVAVLSLGCATARPAAIYGAGAAADLMSTERALAGGAAEANPAMQGGSGERAAIKAAARPSRCRWILRSSWLALHGWLAARNSRTATVR